MRHRQRIANGNRRIDGISPLLKDIDANLGRHRIHGCHHPLLRTNRVENILFNTV